MRADRDLTWGEAAAAKSRLACNETDCRFWRKARRQSGVVPSWGSCMAEKDFGPGGECPKKAAPGVMLAAETRET